MMRSWRKWSVLVVVVGVLSLTLGCGVNNRTPQQIAQDEIITKKVLGKLEELPLRPPPQDRLFATTEQGIVHLWGVVEDWYIKDKAINLAKSVEGVRAVTENIRVEPERGGGGAIRDGSRTGNQQIR